MNIGMVLDNEFTGDMRVENEVIKLQEKGYSVFILAVNYGTKPTQEEYFSAQIQRQNISLFIKKKIQGLANTAIDIHAWFWSKKIKKFIQKNNIQVLHVHDLHMLKPALIANKKFKLPLVSDLHENYAEALKHYTFTQKFPGKYIVSIPKWEKMEKVWLQQVPYIITVIEEALERYKALNISAKKLTVVENYVNSEAFLKPEINETIIEKFKPNFNLLYVGGFDIHRGLESVVKALPELRKAIPEIKLILVGSGATRLSLEELAKSLHVDKCIAFEGWQEAKNLPSYIQSSQISLIPHLKTVHTDNTIPHKLFQYMLLEKPVLSSHCNPLQRIVNESNAGLVYESNNEKDFAQKVIQMYNDKESMQQMAKNGKKAVAEKYNWNVAAQKLLDLYENIEKTLP